MKELVVIAEKEELKLVQKLGYTTYPVLITGVGALNVIETLRDIPKDTKIINIGYAGSKDLPVRKFYVVDYVAHYHPNVSYAESYYKLDYLPYVDNERFDVKSCYTGCDFVLGTELKDCLFDMELAYIMALGFTNVISFKYVSDNLDLQEYREKFNEKS